MARIELQGVTKRYGTVTAVADLDLTIRNREFLVLLGPSGCGKTTVLRLIAGLDRASSGDILMSGERVNDQPPGARDVAMVFQNYGLYPHMTVAQNIAFPLKIRKTPKPDLTATVRAAAARVGLDRDLDRLPGALSDGQRQRIALARASVRSPKLFLMDDPLSNLDAPSRATLRSEIRTLTHDLAASTLFVTHDQVEAMMLADRLVVMRNGQVQQVGRPDQIYDRPENAFVAGFLGNPGMNLMRGDLRGGVFRGQSVQVEGLDGPDGPTLLGFRAEDAEVLIDPMGFTGCEVVGPLMALDRLGDAVLLRVAAGGGQVAVRADKTFHAMQGEMMRIIIPPDICHLFHPGSGRRLDRPAPLLLQE